MTGEPMGDFFHRIVIVWSFAMALIVGLLNGGPPSGPSPQLSFSFMEEATKRQRKLRLQRFYPYTTPFGNS